MNVLEWFEDVKKNPDFDKVGMILCHNGVVRGHSRSGKRIRCMQLEARRDLLGGLVSEMSKRAGIVEVKVWLNEGILNVGDDIMYVLVAGDIRENVFSTLKEIVSRVKKEIVVEKELA